MQHYIAEVELSGYNSDVESIETYIERVLNENKNTLNFEDFLVANLKNKVVINITARGFNWYYVSDIIKREISNIFPNFSNVSIVKVS